MLMTLLTLAALVVGVTTAVLIVQRFARFELRDVLALLALASMALWVSRFDLFVSLDLFGRPYRGVLLFAGVLALALGAMRKLYPQRPNLDLYPVIGLGIVFTYLSVLSGLINGGWDGLGSTLQVLTFIFAPMLLGGSIAAIIPRTPEGAARFRLTFALLGGLATAAAQLLVTLFLPLIAGVLGWDLPGMSRLDTVRGWSPIGGPIDTGFVMVLAYGFMLHEVIGRGRKIYAIGMAILFVSLLFTLSRSAVIMLLVLHLVYFWRLLWRRPAMVLAVGAASLVIGFGAIGLLEQRYDLSRLVSTSDESTSVRAGSAMAALEVSLESPLFGKGPGLLYTDIRTLVARGAQPDAAAGDGARGDVRAQRARHGAGAAQPVPLPDGRARLDRGVRLLRHLRRADPARVARRAGADHETESLGTMMLGLWIACLVMFLTSSGPMVSPKASVFFWAFAFYGTVIHRVDEARHVRRWSLRPVRA